MRSLHQLAFDFTLPKITKELRHRYWLDIATRHEDYSAATWDSVFRDIAISDLEDGSVA